MARTRNRRDFLRELGVSAAALPFAMNLPSLGFAAEPMRKKRLVVMFSPNGVIPSAFWPDEAGKDFKFKESLTPLEPFKDRTMILHGVCDKVRGDGDNHMRGMGCLLTGIELFPGNIQGGSDTPAGWASGLSIDQEIKRKLQSDPKTRTRFGSLEFGVMVPERADTWTRMVYDGPNKPVAPIDNPYQMFAKLYGRMKDQETLKSILDDVQSDLKTLEAAVSVEDRRILEEHATFVREMEQELKSEPVAGAGASHAVPEIEQGIKEENDNIPKISKTQIELMVQSFSADFARVATLQYTNSVGGAKMHWIGVNEGHHELSHNPDSDKASVEKLTKINKWFCEQLAYLTKRLAETPEPGGPGSLLDNTTIIWTNELGKGNSHTLDDIPFVLVGNGLDFKMGQSIKFPKVPHNRLLLSIAHGMGHEITKFGNPDHCGAGPLTGLS
ncbi:DUF1552 domain-containing protein [Paludisphaera borealis]|uniref:DUF1552 domain-containing protein n=1 Tax=Paludisphaera borealis TaxID=1387353 RepID=A0A1U7CK44_9BACT|nr:DUF1552 domain-containing protein [Paludisphaera borealis]APW59302.1 hypothetical protein BSF38_00719 [Paludisphaera borealis]